MFFYYKKRGKSLTCRGWRKILSDFAFLVSLTIDAELLQPNQNHDVNFSGGFVPLVDSWDSLVDCLSPFQCYNTFSNL